MATSYLTPVAMSDRHPRFVNADQLDDSHKVAFSTAPGGPAGGPFEVQRLGTSLTYDDGEDG
jgi:hypothetical protein